MSLALIDACLNGWSGSPDTELVHVQTAESHWRAEYNLELFGSHVGRTALFEKPKSNLSCSA